MDKTALKRELKRLDGLLEKANIPQQQQATLEPIKLNLAFQKVQLDEAMEELMEAGIISEYKNGKTQTGTHQNPLFKSYLDLWRSYMAGFDRFTAYLPKEKVEEEQPDSVLNKVIAMRRAK